MALIVQTREQERDTLPPLLTPDWPIIYGLNNMQPIQPCYIIQTPSIGVCVSVFRMSVTMGNREAGIFLIIFLLFCRYEFLLNNGFKYCFLVVLFKVREV